MEEKAVNHVYDVDVISFDIAQKDIYELDLKDKFHVILREGRYYVERIKPQYPKTYNECAQILLERASFRNDIGYKEDLLIALQRLLVCRGAYWKIAGEQMDLGKPWEPKLDNNEKIFYIHTVSRRLYDGEGNEIENQILAFPTKEMRDAFNENFKELIEQCKELL